MEIDNFCFGSPRSIPKDSVLRAFLSDVYQCSMHDDNEKRTEFFADNAAEACKVASLFAPRQFGLYFAPAVYALDQLPFMEKQKCTDVIADLCMGAAKGLLMRHIGDAASGAELHPLTRGAAMGLGARLGDIALTRSTWQNDGTHRLDGWQAMQKMAAELTNRDALLTDISMFALARIAAERVDNDLFVKRPHLAAGVSGSILGTMGGAVHEIQDEQKGGTPIDWTRVVTAGACSGMRDGMAASLGSDSARMLPERAKD
jgi:hypothetical protein